MHLNVKEAQNGGEEEVKVLGPKYRENTEIKTGRVSEAQPLKMNIANSIELSKIENI